MAGDGVMPRDPAVTHGTCRHDVTTTWRNWWRRERQLDDGAVVGSGRRVIDRRRSIDPPSQSRGADGTTRTRSDGRRLR